MLQSILFLVFALYQSAAQSPGDGGICNLEKKKAMHFARMWIPKENSQDLGMDGNETILNGPKDKELNLCNFMGNGKGPAVSSIMLNACKTMPYNCKLEDQTIYYYDESNDCFIKVDSDIHPWGRNQMDKSLDQFVSVAANGPPVGTILEIEELKNMTLPNSTFVHNGCVRVDLPCLPCKTNCDTVVLFIGDYSSRKHIPFFDHITVKSSNCQILKYD